MKKKQYISALLQLLFMASLVLRIFDVVGCDCHVHAETKHEHICCHCPEHAAECANHDQKVGTDKCHNHFSFDEFIVERTTTGQKQIRADVTTSLTSLCAILSADSNPDYLRCSKLLRGDIYSFSSTEWGIVCKSLRAPPVLV